MNDALVLLLILWAALFVPGAVRARNTSPHVTVVGFERAMNVLGTKGHRGGGGRQLMVPADPARIVARPVHEVAGAPASTEMVEDPVIVRRRMWFVRALLACTATLGFGLLLQGVAWLLFLATLTATLAYLGVLRRLKLQRDEARQVVRQLDLGEVTGPEVGQVAVGGTDVWVGSGTVRLRRWDG